MRRRDVLAGLAFAGVADLARAIAPAAGDIAILRRAYTLLHPGLYRYATPGEVDARFDRLTRAFSREQTLGEAYLTLSRFLATVKCGHTYANFYNQKAAVVSALFSRRDKLPFHFRVVGGHMVVTRSFAEDPAIVRGTEILAVDGHAPRAIMRALLPYARADGNNDAKRRALLEVHGFNRFETFDVFHPLLFPVRDGAFTLRVRPPGQQARTVRVPALDLAGRRAGMVAGAAGDGPAWTLDVADGVARLTMPTWALYNSKWDWRAWLDERLASIADARALIVDLRGNEGGLDCGHEIIARLIDADLTLDAEERRIRFRRTPDDLNRHLDTWDDSFRTLGVEALDRGDGFFTLPAADGVSVIRRKGPRFRGKLFVLTDAQMSSATFQFAQVVQQRGLGRLVGGPTGGNQRGINGGAFFFLRLPESGLEADLPLIGRFPVTPRPDAGVAPDVPAEDSPADIAAGHDRVLETARKLARA